MTVEYDRAVQLHQIVSEQVRKRLGRFVGSALRRDRDRDEWVIQLMISWKVSSGEAKVVHDISDDLGIRIEYFDEMQPARLATG